MPLTLSGTMHLGPSTGGDRLVAFLYSAFPPRASWRSGRSARSGVFPRKQLSDKDFSHGFSPKHFIRIQNIFTSSLRTDLLQHVFGDYAINLIWNNAFGPIQQGRQTGRISVPCISAKGFLAVRAPGAFGSVSPETQTLVPEVAAKDECE